MPPFIPTRSLIAVKIEATEGVDAVPADADVVAPAFGIDYGPTVEMAEREVQQPSFSRITKIAGERMATISFSTELKGSGAAGTPPPNLAVPLRGCSFAEVIVGGVSVTYNLVSENQESVTVEIRESDAAGNARSKKIIGAKGTVSLEATKGGIVLVVFEFTGKYVAPTDSGVSQFASPSITPQPQPFLSAALSFQGLGTLKAQAVTLDVGNDIVMRNDVNDPTGNVAAIITGRTPTGSIDPEVELVATVDFYSKWTSNTEGVLTYIINGGAGNIVTVTALKAQIDNLGEADRDGLRTVALDLVLNQSVDAGDDELEIKFT